MVFHVKEDTFKKILREKSSESVFQAFLISKNQFQLEYMSIIYTYIYVHI